MDPLYLAWSRFRRRRFDECIEITTSLLERNPLDQGAWFLRVRAETQKVYVDDTEFEEEGIADVLLDSNGVAQTPRPGTSIARPGTSAARPGTASVNAGIRPLTSSGRPLTGYARPGTGSSAPATRGASWDDRIRTAFLGTRPGTTRPLTASGRLVRLGTASMRIQEGGPFIDVARLDLRKYAKRPMLGKALCDYIIYHDHLPRQALDLAAQATVGAGYKDWWWKSRLGKCYYQLGLFRDAEKQLKSSLKMQPNITTSLELAKVYLRLDQPGLALQLYKEAAIQHPHDTHILLAMARVHDQLGALEEGKAIYHSVLENDPGNIEAMACLAADYFYDDQPELSLRLYRRLLLMGIGTVELWNNLGLSCFAASQYDMALSCFERALDLAGDQEMADVWYNIGHVAISIGDSSLAFQAFKLAITSDPNHAESHTNLAVLLQRKGRTPEALTHLTIAMRVAPHMHEPFFNAALIAFRSGDYQEAHKLCTKCLAAYPDHAEGKELFETIMEELASK